MFMKTLRPRIEKATKNHNKYRNPEAIAQLISTEGEDAFTVSFTGTFCSSCGLYNYFEDLLYELLDEAGIKTKIVTAEKEHATESFKVTYTILE
jgi:hypothetical protein